MNLQFRSWWYHHRIGVDNVLISTHVCDASGTYPWIEEKLRELRDLVSQAGGQHVRVLRSHFASLGAPDLVFEQEVPDLGTLEGEMGTVIGNKEFQVLSLEISELLAQGPKREVYQIL